MLQASKACQSHVPNGGKEIEARRPLPDRPPAQPQAAAEEIGNLHRYGKSKAHSVGLTLCRMRQGPRRAVSGLDRRDLPTGQTGAVVLDL